MKQSNPHNNYLNNYLLPGVFNTICEPVFQEYVPAGHQNAPDFHSAIYKIKIKNKMTGVGMLSAYLSPKTETG